SYDIVVGDGVLAAIGALLGDRRRAALVTQSTVPVALVDEVRVTLDRAGVEHETFHIGDGEDHKSLDTIDDLCRRFAQGRRPRGDAVIAIGGGVVGDTAGFAAAVYCRGVDVVQVP